MHPFSLKALAAAVMSAESLRGATSPNPCVGASALSVDGRLLGAAAHRGAGLPHAEPELLNLLEREGKLSETHTLIVTLEPCNHTGRTPPCSETIVRRVPEIKRVHYVCQDPNPKVAGAGAEFLRQHGIEATVLQPEHLPGTWEHQDAQQWLKRAHDLSAPFRKWITTGIPYITIKRAWNQMGSMIPEKGQKTFTRPESLVLAHQLRKRADAIITGAGTILADLPEFTVRHVPDHPGKSRLLWIMARHTQIPSHYLESAKSRGFQVHVGPESPVEVLQELGRRGCLEALVEAGPGVSQAFLGEGSARNSWVWDEIIDIVSTTESDQIKLTRRE